MEIITLIFSGISSIAALLSAIAAFKAKKEIQKFTQTNNNRLNLETIENNSNMIGINNGEIGEYGKK